VPLIVSLWALLGSLFTSVTGSPEVALGSTEVNEPAPRLITALVDASAVAGLTALTAAAEPLSELNVSTLAALPPAVGEPV
jgi:hypothetical protein